MLSYNDLKAAIKDNNATLLCKLMENIKSSYGCSIDIKRLIRLCIFYGAEFCFSYIFHSVNWEISELNKLSSDVEERLNSFEDDSTRYKFSIIRDTINKKFYRETLGLIL